MTATDRVRVVGTARRSGVRPQSPLPVCSPSEAGRAAGPNHRAEAVAS